MGSARKAAEHIGDPSLEPSKGTNYVQTVILMAAMLPSPQRNGCLRPDSKLKMIYDATLDPKRLSN